MKIVHSEFGLRIHLKENYFTRMIIEDPKIMRRFIEDILACERGEKSSLVISDAHDPVVFEKKCKIIFDYFHCNSNHRKIIQAIQEEIIDEILSTELFVEWHAISGSIEKMFREATDRLNLVVEDQELQLKDIIKMKDLKIRTLDDNLLDGLVEYFKMTKECLGTKLYILINPMSFFTESECRRMVENSFVHKYHLLFVDNEYKKINLQFEKAFIIDKDCCIIEVGNDECV